MMLNTSMFNTSAVVVFRCWVGMRKIIMAFNGYSWGFLLWGIFEGYGGDRSEGFFAMHLYHGNDDARV